MAILYAFASMIGALTTFTLLSPYGWTTALLWAPLGGSGMTLAVSILVIWTERAPSGPLGYAGLGRPERARAA